MVRPPVPPSPPASPLAPASAPGNLIVIGQRLRRVLAATSDAKFALDRSYATLGLPIEAQAVRMRLALAKATQEVQTFLEHLERSAPFVHQRDQRDQRDTKDGR